MSIRMCAPGTRRSLEPLLSGTLSAGPISAGQLITQEMFVTPAQLDVDALSGRIPVGKVAIAVSPGPVASVGGLIVPGDRVNVLATRTVDQATLKALLSNPVTRDLVLEGDLPPGLLTTPTTPPATDEDGEPIETPQDTTGDRLSQYINALPDNIEITQTILQDIPVLAVGAQTVDSSTIDAQALGELSVVLEVTEVQAERLELARQVSVLALTLLPADEDYTPIATEGARIDDLFSILEQLRQDLESLDAG